MSAPAYPNAPLKKVTSYDFYQSKYSRPGHGTNWLKLECGHEMPQKSSIPIPKRTRCVECYDAADPRRVTSK